MLKSLVKIALGHVTSDGTIMIIQQNITQASTQSFSSTQQYLTQALK